MTVWVLAMYVVINGVYGSPVNTENEFATLSECNAARSAFEASDGTASFARGTCIKKTYQRN